MLLFTLSVFSQFHLRPYADEPFQQFSVHIVDFLSLLVPFSVVQTCTSFVQLASMVVQLKRMLRFDLAQPFVNTLIFKLNHCGEVPFAPIS